MNSKLLSIYIHLPWCEVKCPYCDFNSFVLKHKKIEVDQYIDRLIDEFLEKKDFFHQTKVTSIFIGGGTPSLIPVKSINKIIDAISDHYTLDEHVEITMEMNPESASDQYIKLLSLSSINRVSIGVQSFCDKSLKKLGRIHNAQKAMQAIDSVSKYFKNINLDIMYGLPDQSIEEALNDINKALSFPIKHFSWYQLTIEPQTAFHKKLPNGLPNHENLYLMEQSGVKAIEENGFKRYEISGYAKKTFECKHNLNYWLFGDYMGLGAGAHSKWQDDDLVKRVWNHKKPELYISKQYRSWESIANRDIPFEYFLNRLRLKQPFTRLEYESMTKCKWSQIEPNINQLLCDGLISYDTISDRWSMTELGQSFYNDVVASFIIEERKL